MPTPIEPWSPAAGVLVPRDPQTCTSCLGLGAYLSWNDSTDDPLLEPVLCRHGAGGDDEDDDDYEARCETFDEASGTIETHLRALAEVRDLIWPPGFDRPDDQALRGKSALLDAILDRLAYLRPGGQVCPRGLHDDGCHCTAKSCGCDACNRLVRP